ncbi:hypothetical protein KC19_VG143600 [Ceratodon purpureus]|uniref:Secreted protein n=1 Tax=Ceratodon purpureus TaxID=3225 RepID=A0A8T0HQ02_CERPU|nr:hypothetical protein KC19_VG143600 [Ceratodon purpureus]
MRMAVLLSMWNRAGCLRCLICACDSDVVPQSRALSCRSQFLSSDFPSSSCPQL